MPACSKGVTCMRLRTTVVVHTIIVPILQIRKTDCGGLKVTQLGDGGARQFDSRVSGPEDVRPGLVDKSEQVHELQ